VFRKRGSEGSQRVWIGYTGLLHRLYLPLSPREGEAPNSPVVRSGLNCSSCFSSAPLCPAGRGPRPDGGAAAVSPGSFVVLFSTLPAGLQAIRARSMPARVAPGPLQLPEAFRAHLTPALTAPRQVGSEQGLNKHGDHHSKSSRV
jgi:hypothetical protein